MRPLLVVLQTEAIEGSLLGGQRCAGWTNRIGLERLVHALVGAVLLRLARKDPLVLNPQPHPPHIQLRQSVNASRRERDAIVGADRGPRDAGRPRTQPLQQLLPPPARMLPSRGADQGGHVIRHAMRTALRRAAAITERGPASFVKSLEPFVSRLAANRVPRAEL